MYEVTCLSCGIREYFEEEEEKTITRHTIFPDKLEIFHLFGNIKDDNCIGLRTGNRFYELNRTTPP